MGCASQSMFINFVQYCLYFSPINTENLCHIYSCEEVLLGKSEELGTPDWAASQAAQLLSCRQAKEQSEQQL